MGVAEMPQVNNGVIMLSSIPCIIITNTHICLTEGSTMALVSEFLGQLTLNLGVSFLNITYETTFCPCHDCC